MVSSESLAGSTVHQLVASTGGSRFIISDTWKDADRL